MPLIRRAGNYVFTRLMKILTKWKIQDAQPGIFAVNKSYLEVFCIPGNYNYTQQILLDAYHKGMRFEQVNVSFNRREYGKSFVSLFYPFKVLTQILILLSSLRPLIVFVPFGLLFLLSSSVVSIYEIVQWFCGYGNRPIEHVNLVLGTGLFGLQILFFGLLAEIIVNQRR